VNTDQLSAAIVAALDESDMVLDVSLGAYEITGAIGADGMTNATKT
jgi:hypothetical protein